jgi:hypothetical protein
VLGCMDRIRPPMGVLLEVPWCDSLVQRPPRAGASRLASVRARLQEVMELDQLPNPRIAAYDKVVHLYTEARQLVHSTHIAGDQGSALKVLKPRR